MLKHQRDAVAAQPVERATGHADQFLTLEQRRSADDAIVRQQAEKAEHRLALARARFADDAEAAARLDLKADALDGLQRAARSANGEDRKRIVWGKSGSVRSDPGCRRALKNKKQRTHKR